MFFKRPQSDGMIERANIIIENMLSVFVDENQKKWNDLISLLMLVNRCAVHESTGISPIKMVFGRSVALPVDLVFCRADPERYGHKLDSEYAYHRMQKREKIHEFARGRLNISFDNIARDYNAKVQNDYNHGDAVWVFYPKQNLGLVNKLFLKWQGPYIIISLV